MNFRVTIFNGMTQHIDKDVEATGWSALAEHLRYMVRDDQIGFTDTVHVTGSTGVKFEWFGGDRFDQIREQ